MTIKLRIIEPYISKYVHEVDNYKNGAKVCYNEIKENNLENINKFTIKNIENGETITIKLKEQNSINQIVSQHNNISEQPSHKHNNTSNNQDDIYHIAREIEYKLDKINQKIDSLIETKNYKQSEQPNIHSNNEIGNPDKIKDDLCNIM